MLLEENRKGEGLKPARKMRPRSRSLPWKLLWSPRVLQHHPPFSFTALHPCAPKDFWTSDVPSLGAFPRPSTEQKSPNSSSTTASPSGPCHGLGSVCSVQIHPEEAGRVVTATSKTRGFPLDDTSLIQSALTKLQIKFPCLKLQGET